MTQKDEQQISQEPRRHETNRCSRLSLTELCEVSLKRWSSTNKNVGIRAKPFTYVPYPRYISYDKSRNAIPGS